MAWQNPATLIDEKTRSLNPDDPSSVQALANAIFDYPHVLGRMPADMENPVKARLAGAEAEFLKGNRPGVREEDVVRLVNNIADKFNLPGFAKTSTKQVRALRMKMALASPIFMGRGLAHGGMQVGDSVNGELSPLQSVHLIAVLADQKFLDTNFQVEPEQWDRDSHAKELERIREQEALLKSQPKVQHRIGTRENPNRQVLQDAIFHSTNSMSIDDAQDLIETAFKTLKIAQSCLPTPAIHNR